MAWSKALGISVVYRGMANWAYLSVMQQMNRPNIYQQHLESRTLAFVYFSANQSPTNLPNLILHPSQVFSFGLTSK